MTAMRTTYDVKCYRCGESELREVASPTIAAEHVENFKRAHRSKCGHGASFYAAVFRTNSLAGDGLAR